MYKELLDKNLINQDIIVIFLDNVIMNHIDNKTSKKEIIEMLNRYNTELESAIWNLNNRLPIWTTISTELYCFTKKNYIDLYYILFWKRINYSLPNSKSVINILTISDEYSSRINDLKESWFNIEKIEKVFQNEQYPFIETTLSFCLKWHNRENKHLSIPIVNCIDILIRLWLDIEDINKLFYIFTWKKLSEYILTQINEVYAWKYDFEPKWITKSKKVNNLSQVLNWFRNKIKKHLT